MITQLQFEEIKDNLNFGLFELFDDYVDDVRVTILNDNDIIIAIDDINHDISNSIQLTTSNFNDLDYKTFVKIINELVYYAQ